jgi:hypothetical protein
MNYFYLKNQLNKTPLTPMQQESFEHILNMIPKKYQDNLMLRKIIDSSFEETKLVYAEAMKKSVLHNVLIVPKVRGLDNEKSGKPTNESEYVRSGRRAWIWPA